MNPHYGYKLESLRKIRTLSVLIMQDLTLDQLNKIPAGFNNNIIWNAAHLVAAQQGVCYMRAGLPTMINAEFYNSYKPGSKPVVPLTQHAVDYIKELLVSTIEQFETDLQHDIFKNYTHWTTRYGVELKDINDAVDFLPFHEGMHIGYMMALKRLVVA